MSHVEISWDMRRIKEQEQRRRDEGRSLSNQGHESVCRPGTGRHADHLVCRSQSRRAWMSILVIGGVLPGKIHGNHGPR